MTVTRTEVVDAVGHRFGGAAASRADLIAYAMRTRVEPAVIDLLRRLPDRSFPDVRQLWEPARCPG